ncbi:MAG: Trm112 family protein [Thaumarchaeota archaeon]|nr:Trm112 family protein [Nitrososphaerota archaeon]
MNKKMMDMLVCPIDKQFPLELYQIKSSQDVISDGALFCTKCSRFYPIIEEIPIMLPDELRDKRQDMDFLEKNRESLPQKIIKDANPWHL